MSHLKQGGNPEPSSRLTPDGSCSCPPSAPTWVRATGEAGRSLCTPCGPSWCSLHPRDASDLLFFLVGLFLHCSWNKRWQIGPPGYSGLLGSEEGLHAVPKLAAESVNKSVCAQRWRLFRCQPRGSVRSRHRLFSLSMNRPFYKERKTLSNESDGSISCNAPSYRSRPDFPPGAQRRLLQVQVQMGVG